MKKNIIVLTKFWANGIMQFEKLFIYLELEYFVERLIFSLTVTVLPSYYELHILLSYNCKVEKCVRYLKLKIIKNEK